MLVASQCLQMVRRLLTTFYSSHFTFFKRMQAVTSCWSMRLNFLTVVASRKSHHPCTTYSHTNYTNIILDISHWGIFYIPDVSAVGCTPVFNWSLVINLLFSTSIFRHAKRNISSICSSVSQLICFLMVGITNCSASRWELMPSKPFQLFLF